VSVAPLDLPGVGDVLYGLRVKNGAGETVWSKDVGSVDYGDGAGGVTFVGACDAGSNPNAVELVVKELKADDGTLLTHPQDFFNPTVAADGSPAPLVLSNLTCVQNEDVLATFDVTLMRSADQGFFDIGVTFSDIFCSAKLDCLDTFLHDLGVRKETVVIAFACTTGQSAAGSPISPTTMYFSDVTIACKDGDNADFTQVISPLATGAGNQGVRPPGLFQWAQYFGDEALAGMNKCYWNLALGLDMNRIANANCTVTAYGTATETPFPGQTVPEGHFYPVIEWKVPVVTSGTLCEENRVNEAGSGVRTLYTGPGRPVTEFVSRYTCGAAPEALIALDEVSCGTDRVARTTSDGGIIVGFDGAFSEKLELPEGWGLEDSCCSAACCK
jgi:hypothetical protein